MVLHLLAKHRAEQIEDFWFTWRSYYKWHWMVEAALGRDLDKWSNDEGLQHFSEAEANVIAEYVQAILTDLQGDTWYAYPIEERALHCSDERGNTIPQEEAEKILAEGGAIDESGAFSREELDAFAIFCRRSGGFGVY